MIKPNNKCKNCKWYGKPLWSVISPCDNCPKENDYETIIQIDRAPIFKGEQLKEAIEGRSISEIKINNNEKTYVNSSAPQTVKLPEVKSYMDFNGINVCFLRKFNWFNRLMIKLFFGLKIHNVGSDKE